MPTVEEVLATADAAAEQAAAKEATKYVALLGRDNLTDEEASELLEQMTHLDKSADVASKDRAVLVEAARLEKELAGFDLVALETERRAKRDVWGKIAERFRKGDASPNEEKAAKNDLRTIQMKLDCANDTSCRLAVASANKELFP